MDSGVRFQELADAAPVLIWRVGPDGTYNWLNKTWLEFRGSSLGEETGRPWGHAIHPAEQERCRAGFRAALAALEGYSVDYRLLRADGQYRWMVEQGRPFFLADGTFAGYLGTCLDISDRKRAELRAQSALADARRALRQRDVLLGEVHHRVKNNLQVILSLLSLRSRAVGDDATRDELLSLSRRIQALGHVQAEIHGDDDVSRIVLVDFLRRLISPLAVLHGRDAIETIVEGPPIAIETSLAGVVGLILAEIIANSFGHAFPDGVGSIAIRIAQDDAGRVLISMQDSGPGFDMREAEARGTVGLSIIRSLARQGDIALTHRPGPGARWLLELPASAATADLADVTA